MIPLLDWALRIVEDIGPDVRDAWREFRQLYTGTHPGQARFAGLAHTERMNLFLRDAHRTNVTLPSDPENPGAIDFKYLACILGLPALSNSLALGPRSIAEASGVPVAGDFFIGSVTGRVDGRPWRDKPITVSELPDLVWVVSAACFVIVSHLSGMRPGEVANLRRGCRAEDPDSGELLLLGHRGKGHDRTAGESRGPASRPWAVVRPVHQAIDLLETLHETDLSSRPACPALVAARAEWAPSRGAPARPTVSCSGSRTG